MSIQELEKWLQELKSGKIEVGKIARSESVKLICDATMYLLSHGECLSSDAKVDFAIKMTKLYDDFEKKFDIAIIEVENEIKQLNSNKN